MKIAVSGNIGAGKTLVINSLAKKLEKSFVVSESFDQNPFLAQYYKELDHFSENPYNSAALRTQFQFFKMNYDREKLMAPSKNPNYNFILHDRTLLDVVFVFMKLIYSDKMVTEDEFQLFQAITKDYLEKYLFPDVLIVVHAPVDLLMTRITQRGREMEKKITPEYLEKLELFYTRFVEHVEMNQKDTKIIHLENDETIPMEEIVQKCSEVIKGL